MEKLYREIEKQDLSFISQVLEKVFGKPGYKNIRRLGGMTNRSYRVTRNDGKEYLVRIPGEGTEKLINRSDEKKSTELACSLEIDTKLYYFGQDGVKVMEFISDTRPMDENVLKQEEVVKQAAEIFHKLHTSGKNTGVKFEVFEMAACYENIIHENDTVLYNDYLDIRTEIMRIKSMIDARQEIKKVPCHCDPLVDNWVLDSKGRLYLIDWEYAGMNDGMWDLADLSIEAGYDAELDEQLLKFYFGRGAEEYEKQRFFANKLYIDYLWTLWGKTRVAYDGEFMNHYAQERYERLKENLKKFGEIKQ